MNDKPARQHGAMEFTQPPVDLDRVRLYRLDRVRQQLRDRDLAGALLFDPVNIRYATDTTNMQIFCSRYDARSVFVATEGPVVLWDFGDWPHITQELPTIDDYRVMPPFFSFGVVEAAMTMPVSSPARCWTSSHRVPATTAG
ncbi:MAG: aminopeptidase P family N-terminal domain-containing protein [Acidiferrobacterales bacterium]|nr:aminopeptidase P family N-terminal domain-containing protein [Acidiferrobacterales bacterium]